MSMRKAFAQLKDTKEESDISYSEQSEDDDDEEGESHFQYHDRHDFQFAQVETKFEPLIARLFQQKHDPILDLKQVILLDSQSTFDLVCNKDLVTEVFKSKKGTRLASYGGTMTVHHKAKVKGYHTHVWFSERAITNILA
jgi:hypothetical protein